MASFFRILRICYQYNCSSVINQHRTCVRTFCQSIGSSTCMDHTPVSECLVTAQTIGHVHIIGINRTEHKNCLNTAAVKALIEVFRKFDIDENLYAAVLHGEGGNFCAGIDRKQDEKHIESTNMQLHNFSFRKPVLAAISGYAIAGGLELALKCDLRILDESAVMGTLQTFGQPLFDNGASTLPKLIGLSHTLDMVTTGRPITATDALRFGLANRVVPTGAALGEAVKLAQSIGGRDQETMLRERSAVFTAVNQNIDT